MCWCFQFPPFIVPVLSAVPFRSCELRVVNSFADLVSKDIFTLLRQRWDSLRKCVNVHVTVRVVRHCAVRHAAEGTHSCFVF